MEIWVNPACSKCLAATTYLDEAGIDYTVRRYLDEPPTAEELTGVLERLGLEPWDVARTGEKVAALAEYFRAAPPADAAWAVHFLIGRRPKRLVSGPKLAVWASEAPATGAASAIFAATADFAGAAGFEGVRAGFVSLSAGADLAEVAGRLAGGAVAWACTAAGAMAVASSMAANLKVMRSPRPDE